MKKIIFIFIVFTYSLAYGQEGQNTDTTTLITPEGVGQYLSELLIERGDINKSTFALNFNEMLPNKDLSKFEDSPANIILSMLKGCQITVNQSWNNLLFNIDSLYIDNDFKYITTYFIKTHKEKYSCVAVLKKSLKYYSLKFDILNWKSKSMYVVSISDTLIQFENMENLKNNFTTNVFELNKNDLNFEVNKVKPENTILKKYQFNDKCNIKAEHKRIPSFNSTANNITQDIKDSRKLIDLSYKKEIEENKLEKKWNDIIKVAQKNGIQALDCNNTSLSNVQLEKEDYYIAMLDYKLRTNDQTYIFTFFLILEGNTWKIINISSIEKEPEFKLNFN